MLAGQPRAVSFWWSLLSSVLIACGGSTPAADSPNSSEPGSEASSEDETEGGETAEGDSESSASAEPAKPTCDDGTCSPCGAALCPSGWYCDESAPGGPACGWLPECAGKATCGCVKKAFSGCSCEEQAGSAHLRCG